MKYLLFAFIGLVIEGIVFLAGWIYGDSVRPCKCKSVIAAEGYYGPQK